MSERGTSSSGPSNDPAKWIQLTPAAPGWTLLTLFDDGKIGRIPVIAWALTAEGSVHPVTPDNLLGDEYPSKWAICSNGREQVYDVWGTIFPNEGDWLKARRAAMKTADIP